MSGHVSLPDGCPHIGWTWTNPDGDRQHPQLGDQRGQLITQFQSWSVPAGGADTAEIDADVDGLVRQGLTLVPGSLHHCQTDPDTGNELWVAEIRSTE